MRLRRCQPRWDVRYWRYVVLKYFLKWITLQEFVSSVIAYQKKSNATLSVQEEVRLIEMGATVRNSCYYFDKVKSSSKEREVAAKRVIMRKMSTGQLFSLLSFHRMMGQIFSEVLQAKLQDNGTEL
ncbi:hypothetical protein PTKIN_Ptkin15bG0192700 [Pterospermum kingtungense]